MVIKSRKRTVKTPVEDLIIKGFMEDPLPMGISRVKDGTYVEVNKACLKIIGLPRKQVIGHTSIELGFFTPEIRKLLIDDIKKQGFAKNISGRIIVKDKVGIHLLFRAFPIKMEKETLLNGLCNRCCQS